jgi:hypothetical protein
LYCETSIGVTGGDVWRLSLTIPGDANGDGDVDICDVVKLCAAYGTRIGDPGYNVNCDINPPLDGDGKSARARCSHYGE